MSLKPYFERDGVVIYHGDCLDVLPHLSSIGAVITDPPYSSGGLFRSDRTKSTVAKYVQSGTASYRPEFSGDNRDQRSFLLWCSLWLNAARKASRPGALIASFIDWRQLPTMTDCLQVGGWVWRGIAVWSKKWGRPRAGGFSSACEFLVWGSNGPMVKSDVYLPGIFECSAPSNSERQHITQKPEAVMRWALGPVPRDAVVCDPFMGSGTTLVAARDLGLRAIGIEVDEAFCEVAARRLEQGVLQIERTA